mgnify:FL=1
MTVNSAKIYSLAPHMRVRDESFGLLFYNTKNTGLIFINSGDLIKAAALKQGGTKAGLAPQNPVNGEAILEKLLGRGILTC